MNHYHWQDTFLALFDKCLAHHRGGKTNWSTWYSEADLAFLASIGHKPGEFFDFVDDFANGGGVSPASALLIAAVRRDYFTTIQKNQWSPRFVAPSELPAKTAAVDGITWLPRVLAKARAKLRGEMDPDTMFGCGGDRDFFTRHDIHPADFLRHVWSAGDDDAKVISWVQSVSRVG